MRRRLINSTLAVVLVVIAVFGVSLVIVETRTISASAQESVESEALRLISVVEEAGCWARRRSTPACWPSRSTRPGSR